MADVATLQQIEPATTREVTDALRHADAHGQAVVLRGNGTKARWGAPPHRTDLVLSLRRIAAPIEHCAGDLTVTAPAGATLADINAQLAYEGQWLPVDPWAGDRCTVGGMVATNDSGPRRHHYGAPRDLLIGIEFALANGCLAKGGGRVVKNVAGYDMGRLLCGSFGTLAVMTSATFKLSPRPQASRTVVVRTPTDSVVRALLIAIGQSPLTPTAVEVAWPDPRCLVRFETTEAAADRQADIVTRLAAQHGASGTILAGADEDECWEQHASSVRGSTGALLRIGVLPMEVPTLLTTLQSLTSEKHVRLAAVGRALLGAVLLHVDGDATDTSALVAHLRTALHRSNGHVSVLASAEDFRRTVSTWDGQGNAAAEQLMRAVKAQFDPRGTLCPGGGPWGLA
jgi:glycolate oxidase FAD binding subunit